MKAAHLRIHNFRSILDADIEVRPYGLLVGPNGAGKSNVLAAIRAFYDDIKFAKGRDFPRMETEDEESWVEIEYQLDDGEAETLKEEYLDPTRNSFRVRRYFQTTEKDSDGKSRAGGVFGYVKKDLSGSRFYGAKNIQQAKLGQAVYIPAVTKLDDHTKLSGPSSLRELLNYVLRSRLEESEHFEGLTSAFLAFRETLKGDEEGPLRSLEMAITKEIAEWGHRFALDVRSLTVDELLKGLVAPKVIDGHLEEELEPGQFGHGFQRHLIFSLVMLAARHAGMSKAKPKNSKKEFDPNLFWVLYEEPEAFLHPPQAEVLNVGLRNLSRASGHQVLVTTHSSHFASKNLAQIPSLVRLSRHGKATKIGQVKTEDLPALFDENQDLPRRFNDAGVKMNEVDLIEMEAIKYSLWLNPQRASALFAQHVLLVEGPTERALVGYLVDEGRLRPPSGGLAVIDTLGKFNMPRFMNLLGALHIPHAVLYDQDERKQGESATKSSIANQCIEGARNPFTATVEGLTVDLEESLNIEKPEKMQDRQKPQYLLHLIVKGEVDETALDSFITIIQRLVLSTAAGASDAAEA